MGEVKNFFNCEAISKLRQLAMDAEVGFLSTNILTMPLNTRPMSTQIVDEEGNFWFFSRSNSMKNKEIADDPRVHLFYTNIFSSEYLTIYGHAECTVDRDKINEIWTPSAKAWFTQGKYDPEISLIKVKPVEAYYWDSNNNKVVSLLKSAINMLAERERIGGFEGAIKVKL